ncbi:MAG: aldehyde dehydrogenase family protein, partial [Corynebacterium sp.]|nr:aldehyde dehydrogenase family protein [Corynebacterium sp.]
MIKFESVEDALKTVTAPEGRECIDPATGELIGRSRQDSPADLDQAIAAAHRAQPQFAQLREEQRCEILNQAADALEESAEALAQLLTREQGKPLNGPNARFEVGACIAWLRATAALESPDYEINDEGVRASVTYRPLGVVGAIGPWNWPMMTAIWQLAPALRMGNAVIVKPSEFTPLSVRALCAVLNGVLPQDVLHVVVGGKELGAALSRHEGIQKITFTGSTKTGQKIVESSAHNLTRLTLELGGNDAGIVLDDAVPADIAQDLFWGAFINSGQTCAAMKRLYVPESLYSEVCEELVKVAKATPMGVGTEENNVLGPLQNRQQFNIVDTLVKAAKASGAHILLGGDPDYDHPGNFYPTTLVADIDADNPLVAEEQFGPALPIVSYT